MTTVLSFSDYTHNQKLIRALCSISTSRSPRIQHTGPASSAFFFFFFSFFFFFYRWHVYKTLREKRWGKVMSSEDKEDERVGQRQWFSYGVLSIGSSKKARLISKLATAHPTQKHKRHTHMHKHTHSNAHTHTHTHTSTTEGVWATSLLWRLFIPASDIFPFTCWTQSTHILLP